MGAEQILPGCSLSIAEQTEANDRAVLSVTGASGVREGGEVTHVYPSANPPYIG